MYLVELPKLVSSGNNIYFIDWDVSEEQSYKYFMPNAELFDGDELFYIENYLCNKVKGIVKPIKMLNSSVYLNEFNYSYIKDIEQNYINLAVLFNKVNKVNIFNAAMELAIAYINVLYSLTNDTSYCISHFSLLCDAKSFYRKKYKEETKEMMDLHYHTKEIFIYPERIKEINRKIKILDILY